MLETPHDCPITRPWETRRRRRRQQRHQDNTQSSDSPPRTAAAARRPPASESTSSSTSFSSWLVKKDDDGSGSSSWNNKSKVGVLSSAKARIATSTTSSSSRPWSRTPTAYTDWVIHVYRPKVVNYNSTTTNNKNNNNNNSWNQTMNRYWKDSYYIQTEILESLPKERIPLFHHILAECAEDVEGGTKETNESQLIIKDKEAAEGFAVFLDLLYAKHEQAEHDLLLSSNHHTSRTHRDSAGRRRRVLHRFAEYFGAKELRDYVSSYMKRTDHQDEGTSRTTKNNSKGSIVTKPQKTVYEERQEDRDDHLPATFSESLGAAEIREGYARDRRDDVPSVVVLEPDSTPPTHNPLTGIRVKAIRTSTSGQEAPTVNDRNTTNHRTATRDPSVASGSSPAASQGSWISSTFYPTKRLHGRRHNNMKEMVEILPSVQQENADNSTLEPTNLLQALKERKKTTPDPTKEDSEITSCLIALCMEQHKRIMTKKLFYHLTSKEFIPHIDQGAAIRILTLEEELGHWTDRDNFSSVQTRCARSLLADFEGFRQNFASDKACWKALRGVASSVLALLLIHATGKGSLADDLSMSSCASDESV